jgi:hypothetical protein
MHLNEVYLKKNLEVQVLVLLPTRSFRSLLLSILTYASGLLKVSIRDYGLLILSLQNFPFGEFKSFALSIMLHYAVYSALSFL